MADAQIKGGLFAQYGSSLSQQQGVSSNRRFASMMLSRMRGLRELMLTLDGTAAGSTATEQNKRVAAAEELGGVRTIETQDIVNRATVAGDVTTINADILALSSKTYDGTPPANGDGNPLGTR